MIILHRFPARNTNTHIWVLPIAMLISNFALVIYYNV